MNPIKLEFQNPDTRERQKVEVEPWQVFSGVLAAAYSFRSLAALHCHAAMLANPQFEPARHEGESAAAAYARRACDYADALVTELQRREREEQQREAAEHGRPAREEGAAR